MTRISRRSQWILGLIAAGFAAVAAARILTPDSGLLHSSGAPAPSEARSEGVARPLQIGSMNLEGSGCSAGVKKEPLDRPELFELGFPAFSARTDSSGPTRASCNIALAITVPRGMAVRMIGAEWSGRAAASATGKAQIRREIYLEGGPNRAKNQAIDPGFSGSFFLQDDMRDELEDPDSGWTACAGEPALHVARASVELAAEGPDTSVDLGFGRVFNLETQPCATR